MTRKGAVKKRLLQIVFVTAQIAISRRVSRDDKEGGGAETSAANRLCDCTDRHFEEGVALQTPAQGPPGSEKRSRQGGMTDPHPDGAGTQLGCGSGFKKVK